MERSYKFSGEMQVTLTKIIFLHGLSSNGPAWTPIISKITAPFAKLICPTAPTVPVMYNSGRRMPAWFDMTGLDFSAPEDAEGIKRSSDYVHQLIKKKSRAESPPLESFWVAFRKVGPSLCILVCELNINWRGSSQCPAGSLCTNHFLSKAAKTPILSCHGDKDPIVTLHWGQKTATLMKQFQKKVNFRVYKGLQHSFTEEELQDITNCINQQLPSV